MVGDEVFRTFFESLPQPVFVVDAESDEVLTANHAAVERFGYPLDELREMTFRRLAPAGLEGLSGPSRLRCRDGETRAFHTLVHDFLSAGHPLRIVVVLGLAEGENETELQVRGRILEMIGQNEPLDRTLDYIVGLLEARCRAVLGAIFLLRDGKFHQWAAPHLPVEFLQEIEGLPLDAGPGPEGRQCPCWTSTRSVSSISEDPRWHPLRNIALAFGLRTCWEEPIISSAGEVLGVVNAYLDEIRDPNAEEWTVMQIAGHLAGIAIEQRNLMADLWHQAHYDPSTRLPNRHLLDERLEQSIQLAAPEGRSLGLLHVDIDRYQTIKDLLGRDTADMVLEQLARRVESVLGANDTLARGQGSEFLVLLALDGEQIGFAAERIRLSLLEPFAIQGHELTLSATIGCAHYPEHGSSGALLQRNAETAMHYARRLGRTSVQIFEPEMGAHTNQRVLIESSLGRALAREEFHLVYQPQFELATGFLAGAEALLRWKHPVIGSVAPGTFIPIADESGLIVSIGAWVLETACRQAAQWRASGFCPPRLAVNVSPIQFFRDDFVDSITRILAKTGLPASALELELTESCLVQDTESAARRMHALAARGVCIAMDDFGSGYSSLASLSLLPFTSVKIDQSFVRQIVAAGDRPALIRSIVSVSKALGRTIVAEGIETAAQRDALTTLGCDIGQGYFLGLPAEPETFSSLWGLAAALADTAASRFEQPL